FGHRWGRGFLGSGARLGEYDESITKLNFSETEVDDLDSENEGIETYAGTRLRYSWNYNTYPYDFGEQKWSKNVDIYNTYASAGEENYSSKFTCTLINPTGLASYEEAIREGYLRKDGELQSYYFRVSGNNNNVLLMIDDDVIGAVLEKDTLKSVLSDDSDSCIGGTQSGRTIDGRYKTIYNLQLRDGEYIIAFMIDKVTSKNHYALYTGCPLPIMNTGMFAGTHNGRVNWNGGGLKAETERECPAITISTPSGVNSDLFAISKVWFEDKAPGGSQDLYVSDVTYYYASPSNYSYRILSRSGKTYYDNTPSSGSVAGTYRTKFRVTWGSNLSYVGAYYSANTMMYINYLTPYGMYEGM
ncbi:MAG: hypothetical protein K2M22_11295, partial [Lachnospiraceae bacterium]|nr:hypothetical protein [Lachnospiraceae bacterium]